MLRSITFWKQISILLQGLLHNSLQYYKLIIQKSMQFLFPRISLQIFFNSIIKGSLNSKHQEVRFQYLKDQKMQLNQKHGVNFLYIFSSCLEKHFELKISLCCQSPQVNKFTRLSKYTIQDFAKEGKIGRGDKLLKMVLSPSAILEFPSKRFLKLTVFFL